MAGLLSSAAAALLNSDLGKKIQGKVLELAGQGVESLAGKVTDLIEGNSKAKKHDLEAKYVTQDQLSDLIGKANQMYERDSKIINENFTRIDKLEQKQSRLIKSINDLEQEIRGGASNFKRNKRFDEGF